MRRCGKCGEEKSLNSFRQRKSGRRKGQYYFYCKECNKEKCRQWYHANKEYKKEYRKEYYAKYPWKKHFNEIVSRCTNKNQLYHKRGIKTFLRIVDVKYLWFKDRAYLLERPSIDRIDTYGNYTLENCRFIEYDENMSRPKARRKK